MAMFVLHNATLRKVRGAKRSGVRHHSRDADLLLLSYAPQHCPAVGVSLLSLSLWLSVVEPCARPGRGCDATTRLQPSQTNEQLDMDSCMCVA